MTTLAEALEVAVQRAFAAAGYAAELGQVSVSQRPDLGDYQSNDAFAAAKKAGKPPRDIAQEVVEHLRREELLADATVAGAGFINLVVDDEGLARFAQRMVADQRLGCPLAEEPRKIVIDFGGANVAKAMHVGHLRSAIIGDCLQRLLRFMGHTVVGDIHLGDWGTQMGMVIREIERDQPDLPYFDSGFTGDYPERAPVTLEALSEIYPRAASRAKGDPEEMASAREATADLQRGRRGYRALWERLVEVSREALEKDFDLLGVKFDLWWGESTVQDEIQQLVDRLRSEGHAVESDGAVVVHLEAEADQDPMPPLILLKSDGAAMYTTTDLATIAVRVRDLEADEILYVVDRRQGLHFRQLFAAARQTGLASTANLGHIKFGTVNGPDGRPFKTRSGGVLSLRDLLTMALEAAASRLEEAELLQGMGEEDKARIAEDVGVGAVKYADLRHHRESDYVFDLDKFMRLDGTTGPYIQYAIVRGKSILRAVDPEELDAGEIAGIQEPEERELLLVLCRLPDAVRKAADGHLPHYLASYAYDLARAFNRFYVAPACHVLRAETHARRGSLLALSLLTSNALELVLELMGIEAPERM